MDHDARLSSASPAPGTRGRAALALLAAAICASGSADAQAHTIVDEARARYERADFDGALERLARAEAADDLVRDDVIALSWIRAQVLFARGRPAQVLRELRRLLSLEPDYEPGPEASPSLREAVERARRGISARLSVRGRAAGRPGALTIRGAVRSDPEGLARALRLHTRVGEGSWQTAEGPRVVVDAPAGARVRYYVEALGPGGALLATDGTRAHPRDARVAPDLTTTGEGGGAGSWLLIGGAAVATAAAVVAVVLLTSSTEGAIDVAPPVLER